MTENVEQNYSDYGYQQQQNANGTYGEEFTDYSNQEYYNSEICVPGVDYWNAVANTPAFPPGNDFQGDYLERLPTNFIIDKERNCYYNPANPNEFYPVDYMKELHKKFEPVEETIVDILKKESTLKKLDTALSLYQQTQEKKKGQLSAISERKAILPQVSIIKLKPRYQIQYPKGLPRHQQTRSNAVYGIKCCAPSSSYL